MHHYRPDETDVFISSGAPTAYADRPTLNIDRTTGNVWVNLGGGSTWTIQSRLASGSYESLAASTATLTSADNGKIFFLNRAAGVAVTLPANATPGFTCSFIVATAPTTTCTITAATADTIIGYPIASLGSDETGNGNAAGDVANFIANTALPSDRMDFVSDGTSWHVRATCKATGAITITG